MKGVLVIDPLRSMILLYISSYVFSLSLLSSVRVGGKYLFPLLYSMYTFILSIKSYKEFTLLIVA